MQPSDTQPLFVGGVSIVVGTWLLVTGATDVKWLFRLRKARWLDRRLGRSQARLLIALTGLALIVLGAVIASGFRLWSAIPLRDSRLIWPTYTKPVGSILQRDVVPISGRPTRCVD